MSKMSRKQYADLFGPTTGDKIRLADTDLYIEIEKDLRDYGDEAVYGGGQTLRDGMGTDNTLTSAAGALDLVITNATVLDPLLGVIKADVGIKDGKIVGVGKAGNPNLVVVPPNEFVLIDIRVELESDVLMHLATGVQTHVVDVEEVPAAAGGVLSHAAEARSDAGAHVAPFVRSPCKLKPLAAVTSPALVRRAPDHKRRIRLEIRGLGGGHLRLQRGRVGHGLRRQLRQRVRCVRVLVG